MHKNQVEYVPTPTATFTASPLIDSLSAQIKIHPKVCKFHGDGDREKNEGGEGHRSGGDGENKKGEKRNGEMVGETGEG